MFAADISGKWTGTVEIVRDGEKRTTGAIMVLKQEGSKVTGTVGRDADRQFAIKTGTIEDGRITLEVVPDSGPAVVKFALKLDGDDRIAGDLKGEGDDGAFAGTVDLKREK